MAYTRCKPGDLAMVIRDEPECQANIGTLVRVVEQSFDFWETDGPHWKIELLSSRPAPVVIKCPSSQVRQVLLDTLPRTHPDAWLHPIRDNKAPEKAIPAALTLPVNVLETLL